MSISSPSTTRLPHASAGPFWSLPPAEPAAEWHEIETLLTMSDSDGTPTHRKRRGIPSFAFVAAALVIGGGILAAELMETRSGCGAACHVVTADTTATGKPAAVETAGLAPQSDARVVEGRSAAEPAPGADDAARPDPMAAPAPRRHRHHHHVVEP